VEKRWIPGNWNSIADYGSRCVQAQPEAALTAEQQFECNFFALLQEGRGGGAGEALPATTAGILAQPTVVPGHLPMASVTAKIVAAQAEASPEERTPRQRVLTFMAIPIRYMPVRYNDPTYIESE
jgi:hypothetical protein